MTYLGTHTLKAGAKIPPGESFEQRIPLATGELEVVVMRAELAPGELCGFAARRNTRRGFLFVSKVLGRHLPARPSSMRAVQCCLAEKIPTDLPGPVIVIGLAETAICLGQGVHERYLSLTERDDVLFIHTTRLKLGSPVAFEFLEEHSHATRHRVYMPVAPKDRLLFANARSAVLVDDETSTGRTFVNLTKSMAAFSTRLERVLCLTLTDWRGPEAEDIVNRSMPLPSSWLSLLRGHYRFFPREVEASGSHAAAFPESERGGLLLRNNGRLGLRVPPLLPEGMVGSLGISPGDRILVLGTGEFSYLPFRLAETLENLGCEAYCQATTRSPVLIGHAIGRSETFPDNYGSNSPNFLYNVEPETYHRILVCSETPLETLSPRLLQALGAVPLVF